MSISWSRSLVLCCIVNFAVAGLFSAIDGMDSFRSNLLISFSIGGCCWLSIRGMSALFPAHNVWLHPVLVLLCIPIGLKIAALFGTVDLLAEDGHHHNGPLAVWLPAVIISLIVLTMQTFYFRSKILASELDATRRREAESRQAELAAQLALLQAQVEPHFLFNTLATVQSLIPAEPQQAVHMLASLNTYLRASLNRTRQQNGTVAQELELVRALVDIAAIRMGDRLQPVWQVDRSLDDLPLPPLLLQPLVENAIRHGLEPCLRGGRLTIVARADHSKLLLSVEDNGVGMDASAPNGIGLINIKHRLKALYGEQASLHLQPNQPSGVIAQLELPLAETAPCQAH
ncbi:sensor histidine kinase [Paludibacterium purpuratum]|nr:histidine kinase [Paludibacterium purpuratum]